MQVSPSKLIEKRKKEEKLEEISQQIATSPDSFYGLASRIPSARWARKLHQLQSTLTFKHLIYKKFPIQSAAFEYADKMNSQSIDLEQYFVFACEVGEQGKRNYIVTTLMGFWERYLSLEPRQRWFYEVIPEGQPCHLYFDLEYSLAYEKNQAIDQSRLVACFEQFLCFALPQMIHVACAPTDIVRLDATSPKKFSQHWIVKLPQGAMFADNIQCGYLVRLLLEHLDRNVPFTSSGHTHINVDGHETFSFVALRELFQVQSNAEGGTNWFIDTGVYTRNRNFRLYGSAKRSGTSPPLLISPDCSFDFGQSLVETGANDLSWSVFLHTLVSYQGSLHKVTPIVKTRLITLAQPESVTKPKGVSATKRYDRVQHDLTCPEFPFDESSLQALDEFVLRWIREQPGNSGYLRERSYLADPHPQIRFSVGGNRFCQHIGREHKSNHIYVLADLQEECFVQRCLDPACRGYASPPVPIPSSILVPLLFHGSKEEDEMDGLLLSALESDDPIWSL